MDSYEAVREYQGYPAIIIWRGLVYKESSELILIKSLIICVCAIWLLIALAHWVR